MKFLDSFAEFILFFTIALATINIGLIQLVLFLENKSRNFDFRIKPGCLVDDFIEVINSVNNPAKRKIYLLQYNILRHSRTLMYAVIAYLFFYLIIRNYI